ncbi:MAG: pectin esterase, partial [Lachnospiraceae bacterium]|nr:pectin esterase [Lachnospiraceae bacterium]
MEVLRLGPESNIQKELDKAEKGTRVLLAPGIYRQKIEINVPDLVIEGSGREETVFINGDYAKKKD